MPTVRQAESTECGLAALTVVARAFGHEVDLAWARRRFPPEQRRPDLASLLETAADLGLEARPLRADLADLNRVRLPAILHWDFRHFVVLVRVRRREYRIVDPAAGRRRVSRKEFRERFTGVLIEFSRRPDFIRRRGGTRLRLGKLLAAFAGLRRYLAAMFVLLVATQLLGLVVPVGTQLLVDEVAGERDRQWLFGVVAGIGAVMVAVLVLDTLRQYYGLFTGVRVSIAGTAAMVGHILSLPAALIERRTIADTLSRLDSLLPVQKVLTETSLAASVHVVTLFVTLALMVFYSPLLASMSIAAMLAVVALQAVLLPVTRARNLDGLVAQADARQSLFESLAGAASVQAFGLQARRATHWQQAFVRASNAKTAQGRLAIAASAGQGVIALADQLSFLALGVIGIGNKSLTLGMLFALLSLRGRLATAVGGVLAAGRELYLLRNHLDRVGELLIEPSSPCAGPAAVRSVPSGRIECDGLCYAWHAGRTVVTDFCCEIDAGERVVLCGPSGIGKTTLLRLLACELEPREGEVLFDGWGARQWDRDWLRRHFGVVRQADRLFTGSVADNIAGFSTHPDPLRIRHAAELAAVWDELLTLPMQLDTPLGDGGAGLSGGQFQRVVLARALYRTPKILLLDEPTSQLDERTERRVLRNLAGLGATIVSIAHGPDAIRLGGRPVYLPSPVNGKSPIAPP